MLKDINLSCRHCCWLDLQSFLPNSAAESEVFPPASVALKICSHSVKSTLIFSLSFLMLVSGHLIQEWSDAHRWLALTTWYMPSFIFFSASSIFFSTLSIFFSTFFTLLLVLLSLSLQNTSAKVSIHQIYISIPLGRGWAMASFGFILSFSWSPIGLLYPWRLATWPSSLC